MFFSQIESTLLRYFLFGRVARESVAEDREVGQLQQHQQDQQQLQWSNHRDPTTPDSFLYNINLFDFKGQSKTIPSKIFSNLNIINNNNNGLQTTGYKKKKQLRKKNEKISKQ